MKLVFFSKGQRGLACLEKIISEGADVAMVVLQPNDSENPLVESIASENGIKAITPNNPNDESVQHMLREKNPDVFVLAGYGKIIGQSCLSIPRIKSINLHAGKLPQYRGSSPLNWALINDEAFVEITILEVAEGIDTGDTLSSARLRISDETTIRDLHNWANQKFPEMLSDILKHLQLGTIKPQKQDNKIAQYYPRRFPDDGIIFWDELSARQIHNRIRALTKPYPCVRSFFQDREVLLFSSKLPEIPCLGEPGRVYIKKKGHLLVNASDHALWITEAVFADDSTSLYDSINLYDSLATIREAAVGYFRSSSRMRNAAE